VGEVLVMAGGVALMAGTLAAAGGVEVGTVGFGTPAAGFLVVEGFTLGGLMLGYGFDLALHGWQGT